MWGFRFFHYELEEPSDTFPKGRVLLRSLSDRPHQYKQQAECFFGRNHDVPDPECMCGYWAYLPNMSPSVPSKAIQAVVWGFGKVVLHEEGWRASHIRIVHFIRPPVLPESLIHDLAAVYGATVLEKLQSFVTPQIDNDVPGRKETILEQNREASQDYRGGTRPGANAALYSRTFAQPSRGAATRSDTSHNQNMKEALVNSGASLSLLLFCLLLLVVLDFQPGPITSGIPERDMLLFLITITLALGGVWAIVSVLALILALPGGALAVSVGSLLIGILNYPWGFASTSGNREIVAASLIISFIFAIIVAIRHFKVLG